MIHPELLEILCCPETRQPVREAPETLVRGLNRAIRAKTLKNAAGRPVRKELSGGLVREDGQVLYPVRDGIPIMLIDEAVSVREQSENDAENDRDGGHHQVEAGAGA